MVPEFLRTIRSLSKYCCFSAVDSCQMITEVAGIIPFPHQRSVLVNSDHALLVARMLN